jgi:hypothetical protein
LLAAVHKIFAAAPAGAPPWKADAVFAAPALEAVIVIRAGEAAFQTEQVR